MSNLVPVPLSVEERLARIFLYGDFGQGKTTLAGQIAKILPGKSLLVTTDSNWTVLDKIDGISDKIARIKYSSYGTMPEGNLKLYGMLHDLIDQYSGKDSEFKNLIIDTITTVIDLTRVHLTRERKFNDQRTKDASSWTHFNLIKDQLLLLNLKLTNSPLNIIYIAHEREPSDEDRQHGEFRVRPDLPGTTFKVLARECNMIGYCFKEKNGSDYLVQTEGTNKVTAKSQIPSIEQTIYKANQIAPLISEWIN